MVRARAAAKDCLNLWRKSEAHPGVPLFSGGLLDSWPGWAVDGLAIIREEVTAVRLFQQFERNREKTRNG